MPEEQYYPFVKTLFKSQASWTTLTGNELEKTLVQYARLGGLPEDKAQACVKDEKMMDAVVNDRTASSQKHEIQATPTFIINGTETVRGAQPVAEFEKIFDRLLAAKK